MTPLPHPTPEPLSEEELDRLEELARAAATLRYGRDMVTWLRESNVPEAFVMALSPDVVLRLIAAARRETGLDEAWAEAEAALPKGWELFIRRVDAKWSAIADEPWRGFLVPRTQHQTYEPTPAAALHALATALREAP
jgi:hypothetical protein